MKTRFFLGLMALITAVFSLQSCSDDDDNDAIIKVKGSYINFTRDSVAIDALPFQVSAGYAIIGIDCDGDWTAELSDSSWAAISNHAGYGSTTKYSYVRVSVDRNMGDARSTFLTVNSGNVSKQLVINQAGTGLDAGDPFESSYSFLNNIVLGYNLGNTLESNHDITNENTLSWFNPQTVYDWETCWGQPVTTQPIIDAIAAKGFNVIRVPVTWFPHMDANDNVEEAWMNRVQEVVDMVLKTGCYCIINVHHDASEYDPKRGDGAHWLQADMEQYPVVSQRFKKLWTQIANRFKGYDQHLLFEAVNEILDETGNWGDPAKPAAYEAVNKLSQDFVDAVRATGGNNEWRNLVVNPYSAGNSAAKLAGFQAPSDKHPNHILMSVHSYDPYGFCNDNGEWNVNIFDATCEKEISDLVARVANRADQLGVPFFFGEFGAIDENKSMSERIKYASFITGELKNRGTTGLWWMGLIDRNSLNWYEAELVDALFKGMQ